MPPTDRLSVPCPHPGCDAALKIRPDLPAGDYDCLCRHCRVLVTWIVTDDSQPAEAMVSLIGRDGGIKPHAD